MWNNQRRTVNRSDYRLSNFGLSLKVLVSVIIYSYCIESSLFSSFPILLCMHIIVSLSLFLSDCIIIKHHTIYQTSLIFGHTGLSLKILVSSLCVIYSRILTFFFQFSNSFMHVHHSIYIYLSQIIL